MSKEQEEFNKKMLAFNKKQEEEKELKEFREHKARKVNELNDLQQDLPKFNPNNVPPYPKQTTVTNNMPVSNPSTGEVKARILQNYNLSYKGQEYVGIKSVAKEILTLRKSNNLSYMIAMGGSFGIVLVSVLNSMGGMLITLGMVIYFALNFRKNKTIITEIQTQYRM